MAEVTTLMDATAMHRVLMRIAHEIAERNDGQQTSRVSGNSTRRSIAWPTGWQNPQADLGANVAVGSLDVGMHRDDLAAHAAPQIHPTVIPFDVTGKTVVLVDDVFFSGRTIAPRWMR